MRTSCSITVKTCVPSLALACLAIWADDTFVDDGQPWRLAELRIRRAVHGHGETSRHQTAQTIAAIFVRLFMVVLLSQHPRWVPSPRTLGAGGQCRHGTF